MRRFGEQPASCKYISFHHTLVVCGAFQTYLCGLSNCKWDGICLQKRHLNELYGKLCHFTCINILLAICDVTWEMRPSPSLGCLYNPVDNLFKLFNAAGLLASLVKDLGFVAFILKWNFGPGVAHGSIRVFCMNTVDYSFCCIRVGLSCTNSSIVVWRRSVDKCDTFSRQ